MIIILIRIMIILIILSMAMAILIKHCRCTFLVCGVGFIVTAPKRRFVKNCLFYDLF